MQTEGNTIVVIVRSQQMNAKIDIKRQQMKADINPKNEVDKVARQQVADMSKQIQTMSMVTKKLQIIRKKKQCKD